MPLGPWRQHCVHVDRQSARVAACRRRAARARWRDSDQQLKVWRQPASQPTHHHSATSPTNIRERRLARRRVQANFGRRQNRSVEIVRIAISHWWALERRHVATLPIHDDNLQLMFIAAPTTSIHPTKCCQKRHRHYEMSSHNYVARTRLTARRCCGHTRRPDRACL